MPRLFNSIRLRQRALVGKPGLLENKPDPDLEIQGPSSRFSARASLHESAKPHQLAKVHISHP